MRTLIISSVLATIGLLRCGASWPTPTQHLADAQAAHQSASDFGAASLPKAKLHLKLAADQMTEAKAAIDQGENKRADTLLVRSKADSELALALTREQNARGEANKATEQSNVQRSTNTSQGSP